MANKILVTGSQGVIGTTLVKELRSRGHEVWGCDIKHSNDEQFIRCDVSKYRQLERIFDREYFEYVYHLAAEYGRWNGEGYYEQLWETNVIGTKNLLRLQEQLKFRQIFFSSGEVYSDYNGKMSEDVMDNYAIKQMNDYAMTKWVGEMQCLNSAEMFKTQTVRVRPTNCYGREHYTPYRGVIPVFIWKALHDLPYTVYNGHKRVFDYVTDTCSTLANIVDNFKTGEVYNIGSNEEWEVDIKYVSDLILKHLGKDDSKVIYKETEPFTTVTKHMDFEKSRKDLKHDPKITIEEGIPLTIEWMKKQIGGQCE
jgi:dTDP-glucose 4,6-dehydratase